MYFNYLAADQNAAMLQRAREYFQRVPEATVDDFGEISRIIGLPFYMKKAVFDACCQCSIRLVSMTKTLQLQDFLTYWEKMTAETYDEASRFIFTLSVARSGLPASKFLIKEDFFPLVAHIIDTYSGFKNLVQYEKFHDPYIKTVTTRIFWNVSHARPNKIYASEVKKSTLFQNLRKLEENTELDSKDRIFSYQDFYVIYSIFWFLDDDHDMLLTKENLQDYNDGILTNAIVDRIFLLANTRKPNKSAKSEPASEESQSEFIGLEDFVMFLLAEEDKRTPQAIDYWFRILDVDGDGIISLYEMEQFYEEVFHKLITKRFGALKFKDMINQVLDMVNPKDGKIRRSDLKQCKLAHKFFNTFVNVNKYVEQESDSFADLLAIRESDWEQFSARQYKHFLELEAEYERMENE